MRDYSGNPPPPQGSGYGSLIREKSAGNNPLVRIRNDANAIKSGASLVTGGAMKAIHGNHNSNPATNRIYGLIMDAKKGAGEVLQKIGQSASKLNTKGTPERVQKQMNQLLRENPGASVRHVILDEQSGNGAAGTTKRIQHDIIMEMRKGGQTLPKNKNNW